MAEIPLNFVDLQDDLEDFPLLRGALQAFRDRSGAEEDFFTAPAIVVGLSEGAEPTVQTELTEQAPPIAMSVTGRRVRLRSTAVRTSHTCVVRHLAEPDNRPSAPRDASSHGRHRGFRACALTLLLVGCGALRGFHSNSESGLGSVSSTSSSSVARAVRSGSGAHFRNAGHPHLEVVEEAILVLQTDWDQDVSFFATLEQKWQNLPDPAGLQKQNSVLGDHSQPSPSILGAHVLPEPDLLRGERF